MGFLLILDCARLAVLQIKGRTWQEDKEGVEATLMLLGPFAVAPVDGVPAKGCTAAAMGSLDDGIKTFKSSLEE